MVTTARRRGAAAAGKRRQRGECLLDTGPIVALFNVRDHHHQRAVGFFKTLGLALRCVTTWEVVAEAMVMLDDSTATQQRLMTWLQAGHAAGLVRIAGLTAEELPAVAKLMAKYADLPMDWADASLIMLAIREGIAEVATVDARDFGVYRGRNGAALRNVFLA